MGQLLEKAASPQTLNNAWKRFKKDKAIWKPGVTRKEMEWNMGFHLLELSEELRTNTYIPSPVRFFPVQKGDGRQRIISASTGKDKVAQYALLSVIAPFGERIFHPDSYGYRPNRSVEMAVSRVREYILCGMDWVVDADIKNYFDNISHKPLLRILDGLIPDKELVGLIRRFLDVGAVRRGFLSSAKGIPQGSIISPFLCNIYLTSWDNDMSAKNIPFVRYADDFVLFAKSKHHAHRALEYTEKVLKRLGLQLNMKKTRVSRTGPHIRFLGRKLPKLKR